MALAAGGLAVARAEHKQTQLQQKSSGLSRAAAVAPALCV
jgi:hypothetical protein